MEPVVLRAPDLVLTGMVETDIDAVYRACQDPEIQRWTTVPVPYERHHARGFVNDLVAGGWERGTDFVWAIREELAGDLLGVVGLGAVEGGSATVGYWVVPEARGRGLSTAGLRLAIDFAFGPAGLTRLAWDAVVGNEASRRVAERCGFRIEGQVRGWYYVRGVREDAWLGTLYPADPR